MADKAPATTECLKWLQGALRDIGTAHGFELGTAVM